MKGHNEPKYYTPLLKEQLLVYGDLPSLLLLSSSFLVEKVEKVLNNSHQPFLDLLRTKTIYLHVFPF